MHTPSIPRSVFATLLAALLLAITAPASIAQMLYFADVDVVNANADPERNAIRALNLSTQLVQPILATGEGVRGLDVDAASGKIYWTDVNNFVIRRAALNGTGQEDLVTSGLGFASALRLDLIAGKLYWGDAGNEGVFQANLDGTSPAGSVVGIPFFRGLAIDHAGGKVYWTTSDTTTTGRIFRADMNGANFEPIITGLAKPGNIALDIAGNRIYWTDAIARVVRRANLNGSNVQTIYTGGEFIGTPKAIALDLTAGKVYWSNDNYDPDSGGFQNGTILRMDLDGSNQEHLAFGLGSVNDMAFGPVPPPPCPADFNHVDGITVQDIFDFLAAWFAGSPSADFNGGGLAVNDIFDFLTAWFAGC